VPPFARVRDSPAASAAAGSGIACVPSPARKTCRIACARIKVLSYEMDHASKVHMILTVFSENILEYSS
jgi:hypothetical protein